MEEETKNRDRDGDSDIRKTESSLGHGSADEKSGPFKCKIKVSYEETGTNVSVLMTTELVTEFPSWEFFDSDADDVEMFEEFVSAFRSKCGDGFYIVNTEPLDEKIPEDTPVDVKLVSPSAVRADVVIGQVTREKVPKKDGGDAPHTETFLRYEAAPKEPADSVPLNPDGAPGESAEAAAAEIPEKK